MLLSCSAVVNLHKLNPMLITVIINLLQFFNDLSGIVIVFSVLKYFRQKLLFKAEFFSKYKFLQKTTTKLSMFWINVPNVLAVTSSITSSSSPVDLFSMSHSRTSSSRDNSSAKNSTWRALKLSSSELGLSPDQSERKINECDTMRGIFLYFLAPATCTYFHRWLASCDGSKPISATLPSCIRRPMFRHEFSRSRFQADQPRRRYSRAPEGPWHICGTRACLNDERELFIRLFTLYCEIDDKFCTRIRWKKMTVRCVGGSHPTVSF